MADSAPSLATLPALSALNRDFVTPPHRLGYGSSSTSPPDSDPEEFLTYPPGEPTISLVPAEAHTFLIREFDTPGLDECGKLWLVAQRRSEHHTISSYNPLHHFPSFQHITSRSSTG